MDHFPDYLQHLNVKGMDIYKEGLEVTVCCSCTACIEFTALDFGDAVNTTRFVEWLIDHIHIHITQHI